MEVAKMKCAEKGIESAGAEAKIRSEPEAFKSGRAIERMVVMEYIRQVGEEEEKEEEGSDRDSG